MLRRTLEVRRRVLGEEHPSTLTSQGNLALALRAAGKHEEAAEMHRKTLEVRRHVLQVVGGDQLFFEPIGRTRSALRTRHVRAGPRLHQVDVQVLRERVGRVPPQHAAKQHVTVTATGAGGASEERAFSLRDVAWAFSILHSRCFMVRQRHGGGERGDEVGGGEGGCDGRKRRGRG